MTPPKERHPTDREAAGVADPFWEKLFLLFFLLIGMILSLAAITIK